LNRNIFFSLPKLPTGPENQKKGKNLQKAITNNLLKKTGKT